MAPTVFAIPGLGFTGEVFDRLDLAPSSIERVPWIETAAFDEPLHVYAARLAALLRAGDLGVRIRSGDRPVLLGHSFGGMLAQDLAGYVDAARIVLISSVVSPQENPWRFRVVASAGLHRLASAELFARTVRLWGARFGFREPEDLTLFRRMVRSQSDATLRWSIRELSRWRGPQRRAVDALTLRVHGTRDRTFPRWDRSSEGHGCLRLLEGADHMMLWNRSQEVSEVIRGWLGESAPMPERGDSCASRTR